MTPSASSPTAETTATVRPCVQAVILRCISRRRCHIRPNRMHGGMLWAGSRVAFPWRLTAWTLLVSTPAVGSMRHAPVT